MKSIKKLIIGILVASVLLQPLGLVTPVLAETVRMEYPAPTDPDPKHIHAPKVVNGVTYEYDANGNLVEDERRCVEWNQDNLPVKVILKQEGEMGCENYFNGTKTGVTTKLFYDASGRRIAKEVVGGEKTIYVNQYYQLSTINSQQSSAKYYFANGRIAVRHTPSGGASTLTFLHQDHLGSTVLATDSNSQPTSDPLSYFPYGNNVSMSQGVNVSTNYLFTGQEADSESDLYNYNARLYNPKTGAFVSADTLGSGNRYSYAENNPMVFTDPTGHAVIADGGGGGGRSPNEVLQYEISGGEDLYTPPQGITATDIITLESPQLPTGDPEDFPKLMAGLFAVSLAPVAVLAIPEIGLTTTVFLLTHPEVVFALKALGFAGTAAAAVRALRGDETAAAVLYEAWYMGIMSQAFQKAHGTDWQSEASRQLGELTGASVPSADMPDIKYSDFYSELKLAANYYADRNTAAIPLQESLEESLEHYRRAREYQMVLEQIGITVDDDARAILDSVEKSLRRIGVLD